MDKKKFAAILPIIIAALTDKIIENDSIDENEAIERLYATKLYAFLENEESKVWQYSVPKLFELYRSETETGELTLPDY